MKSVEISKLIQIFKKKSIRHKFLKNLISSNSQDSISTIVFSVLSWEEKQNLRILLTNSNPKSKLSPIVFRETKRNLIKILRIISSFETDWSKASKIDLKKSFDWKMKTNWVALEYFIIDSILRWNPDFKIEKWPLELEWNQIDLVHIDKTNHYWIQITTTEEKNIWKKYTDMKDLQFSIDSWWEFKYSWKESDEKIRYNNKNKLIKENFSWKYIPDAPILFVLNSYTSRKVMNRKNNILWNAFNEWWKDKYPFWWPSIYLEEKIQEELIFIQKSYREVFEEFNKLLLEKKKLQKTKDYKFDLKTIEGEVYVEINPSEKKVIFTCFPKNWDNWESIYKLHFYLTKKLLDKF